MGSVAVVGGGVIGLTCAHELAAAGHRVRVLAAAPAAECVSAVAAALWFPHDVPHTPRVLGSARVAYERFVRLAEQPESGVRVRRGTVLSRRPDPDLAWTASVPEHRVMDGPEVPPGASGVRCTVPVAVTATYLRWLESAVVDLGVEIEPEHVTDVAAVAATYDAVVVAAGLRSADLLGDDEEVFPIRGQVVRLANPGLTDWLSDDDHPDGLTYVVPRDDDVVCGGTGDVAAWDLAVQPEVEAAILRRCRELVPALVGQPVLSRAVGLRPGRPDVRLEAVDGFDTPVIACYGHGGAGFTLSWGDAAEVAGLLRDV